MSVRVQIPATLRRSTAGDATLEVTASSVGEALAKLVEVHPVTGDKLFDGGKLRRFVNVFVNDEDIRYVDSLETAVKDGDEVAIIPAVAGG